MAEHANKLARRVYERLREIGCGIGDASVPFIEKVIRDGIDNAIKDEREACAEIADRQAGKDRTMGDTKAIARAIRARNSQSST